jgi:Plasmid encoded RepA protein
LHTSGHTDMVLTLTEAEPGDCASLDPQMSLHDVLIQRGEAGAVMASSMTERIRGRRATSDVLGGRRGRRIIKAAKEHLDDRAAKAADDARSFIYSAWCHASFPHKPPAKDDETWLVQTDYVTLRVDPGRRPDDNVAIGLPYGSYARLLAIDWSSQAFMSRSRDIELGKNLGDTITRLGLGRGGKTRTLLLDQAERLARCRLTFDIRGRGKSALINQTLVDSAIFNESARGGRFVEQIRLSEQFYQQLIQYPVAINPASITSIRNSSMAIDIYCWLAFRLLMLTTNTEISWAALKGQFGTGCAAMRTFKVVFTENLVLAKSVYVGARADLTEHGITLRPSPPPTTPARSLRGRGLGELRLV